MAGLRGQHTQERGIIIHDHALPIFALGLKNLRRVLGERKAQPGRPMNLPVRRRPIRNPGGVRESPTARQVPSVPSQKFLSHK